MNASGGDIDAVVTSNGAVFRIEGIGIPPGPSDSLLFNSRYSTLVAAKEVTSVVLSVNVTASSVEDTTSSVVLGRDDIER